MTDEATTKLEVAQTKGGMRSSINITGILLVLCSAVSDPFFRQVFGDMIPPEWVTRFSFIAGWIIIYFRSNGANNIPLTWNSPWKPVGNALVEVTTQPGKETVTKTLSPQG